MANDPRPIPTRSMLGMVPGDPSPERLIPLAQIPAALKAANDLIEELKAENHALETEAKRLIPANAALELAAVDVNDTIESLRIEADNLRLDRQDARAALKKADTYADHQFDRAEKAESRCRHFEGRLKTLLEFVRDEAAKHPECPECNGSGGVPLGYEALTPDGMAISHAVFEDYTDPTDEPCDTCCGVGRLIS